jgi:hypothetical protein
MVNTQEGAAKSALERAKVRAALGWTNTLKRLAQR